MRAHLKEGRFVVPAGMLIALPGVHPETARPGLVLGGRLAKREIALAAVNPELNQDRRPRGIDEVIGKMEVARPGADPIDLWFEVARRQIYADNFRSHASG